MTRTVTVRDCVWRVRLSFNLYEWPRLKRANQRFTSMGIIGADRVKYLRIDRRVTGIAFKEILPVIRHNAVPWFAYASTSSTSDRGRTTRGDINSGGGLNNLCSKKGDEDFYLDSIRYFIDTIPRRRGRYPLGTLTINVVARIRVYREAGANLEEDRGEDGSEHDGQSGKMETFSPPLLA